MAEMQGKGLKPKAGGLIVINTSDWPRQLSTVEKNVMGECLNGQ